MNIKTVICFSMIAGLASADVITITALDVRANGVFGHDDVSGVTLNGNALAGTFVSNTLDFAMTYSNLDLDGDASANDEVTFTLRFSGPANMRAFNQGIDTGFGSLNGVTVSVLGVTGTTTDLGHAIQFDGFTGSAIGVGGNGDLSRSAEINDNPVSVVSANTGSFQFKNAGVDFAAVSTVTFDNSGGDFGSVVARHHDLQFSTVIPEPAAIGMILAMSGTGFIIRRRFMQ